MSYYKNSVGIRNVGSYQVSGIPYITGSAALAAGVANEQRISFPAVTKSITVRNTSTGQATAIVRVLLSSGKATGDADTITARHFIDLFSPVNTTGNLGKMSEITLDAKVKEIFIQAVTAEAEFEVYASLTGISSANMPILSGSGINALNPADGTTP